MDKLVAELLALLDSLLEANRQLLGLEQARQEAMRRFDIEALNALQERERQAMVRLDALELQRRGLIERFRAILGRGATPTVSLIAGRCAEPTRSALLVRAGQLREAVETLERTRRINSKVSQAVTGNMARILRIVTGVAQQVGLYMANGRKASLRGVHLLDAVA